MNSTINYLISFLGGAILVHLWNRFIHRISILRYTVEHQHIALSSNYSEAGSIEVLHNKIPVQNLYLSQVHLTNDTNRDLENIIINLTCDDNSIILFSHSINKSSGKNLNFSEDFSKISSNYKAGITNPRNLVGRSEYIIPVINRGDIIDFLFLVTNSLNQFPIFNASCDHLGVKIKFQKAPKQKILGESTLLISVIGLIIGIFACTAIVYLEFSLVIGVWTAFFLGSFVALWGWLLVKLFKFARRIFT